MLKLVRTGTGFWGLDWRDTPEAPRIMELFGGTVLELPVGLATSPEEALRLARRSEAGRKYGVR